MSQHDMDLANQSRTAFRQDLNAALLALIGNSSGATAPPTTFAHQFWADTTTGILKIRNAANSDWISVATLAAAGMTLPGNLNVSGATVLSGAVQLGDGSDVLALLTNNMQTPGANGEITYPLQPAFLATTGGAQDNVTGDGTVYTVLFATEIFDQNADFASSTFTAPVAGRYRLDAGVYLDQLASGHGTIVMTIVASNRSLSFYREIKAAQDKTELMVNGSVLVDMDAADTAHVTVTVAGAAKTVDIPNTGQYTYFSGSLVA